MNMHWAAYVTAAAVCAAIVAGGCSEGEHRAVPRREAYVRLQLPDSAMSAVGGTPLLFMVNNDAVADVPRRGWLDVAYPTIGVEVHITFTPVTEATAPEVMANRMERLMLNSGNLTVDEREFTNPHGFDIYLTRAERTATPIQFLATDRRSMVVSGAAVMRGVSPDTAVEAIAPAVDAVYRDIMRAMQNLQPLP